MLRFCLLLKENNQQAFSSADILIDNSGKIIDVND